VVKADNVVFPQYVASWVTLTHLRNAKLYARTDLSTGSSVLDHDTNVFFAMPASSDAGSIFSLDLSTVTTQASGSAIAWEESGTPNFSTDGRQVVMSQASNHISAYRFEPNLAISSCAEDTILAPSSLFQRSRCVCGQC